MGISIGRIYCDMDQVLVNFLLGAKQVLGKEFNDSALDELEKWTMVGNHHWFWADLQWMPGARKLWEYLRPHDPYVLSASSPFVLDPTCKFQKLMWCRQQLEIQDLHRCIVVPSRDLKQNYAFSNNKPNILIDDHPRTIAEWIDRGGIGIVHQTVPETILCLQNYGL